MNANKTYEIGPVTYFRSGKWIFKVGTFQLLTKCPGGRLTAAKVAKALAASYKRTKSDENPLDGLGRFTINKIVTPVTED
jgi:hypothetical protein